MDSLLPFLQGSCIPYNMPVYPGALRIAPSTGKYSVVEGRSGDHFRYADISVLIGSSMSALAIYRSTRFGRSTNFRIADSPTEIEVLAFGTQATTLTLSRTR
jgi:hypothetical protein